MDRQGAVVLSQPVGAERGALWRAIAEPEGLARWQADVVEGSCLPGGKLRLAWPALGASLELEVVERRERELIELRAGRWQVKFELGEREVTLSHLGLGSDPEVREGTRSGWALSLATLSHALEAHPSRSRSVTWAVSPARVTAAQAHAFFTDAAALGAWLGQGTGIGVRGSPVVLRLASGEALTGRVLANEEGRDVALSWSERESSVLALRTLPLEGETRLLALSWSRWGAAVAAPSVVATLGAAVERLSRLLQGRAEG